MRHGEHSSMDS